MLSAVPPADTWETYLWLDQQKSSGADLDEQRLRHDFIRASIFEIEGSRREALAAFASLRSELKSRGYVGRIATHVDNAITRLSKP